MRLIYYAAGALVAFMIFGLVIWGMLMPPGDDLVTRMPKTEESSSVGVRQARVVGRHKGQRQWELIASEMKVEEDKQMTHFQDIGGGSIYHENAPYMNFKAISGKWFMDNNDFALQGDVTAHDTDGEEFFRAKEIYWQAGQEILLAPEGVWAKWGNLILQGDFFQAFLEKDQILLAGNVFLQGDNYQVWASHMDYQVDEDKLILSGPGRMQLTIKGD